jgi:hypothetical protein
LEVALKGCLSHGSRLPVQQCSIVGEGIGRVVAHIIGVKFSFPVKELLSEGIGILKDLILRVVWSETAGWSTWS